MLMKAIQIKSPGHVVLVDQNILKPKANEVLIKIMASGICGTDIHIFNGDYLSNYPIVPGHEFSGIIEHVGKDVIRFQVGDRVAVEPNISCDNCYYCLNNHQNFCENWQAIGVTLQGGMAQYIIVPEKVTFHINDLPFESGAFMEPLSCVLHGIERINIRISDRVAILGAGPIGLLFLQMVQLQGATSVTVLENQTSRAEIAKRFGANHVANNIKELKDEDFDIVIDATGKISIMDKTIDLVRRGGKVLLFGVPSAGEMINFEGIKLFQKGLTLFSSFTSVRNSYQAISLLQSKQIVVSELISHTLPLSDFGKGVELIEKGIGNVKKVIILPQE
jgi:D-arabinitol dehydrogenase (NADP+)